MSGQQDEHSFVWPGNDEILQRRYGEKPQPRNVRVRLGLYAFIKGWLVTFGVWFAISLIFALVDSFTSPYSIALSIWAAVLFFSFVVAVLLGTPIALLLEFVLRPVQPQWIHVLVFGATYAILTFAVTWLLVSGMVWAFPVGLAVIVGGATAMGRASVRNNAYVYTTPSAVYVPTHKR